ncbi:hypothetical protein FOA52_001341 [Chlamydomonas sp. UWO 241]|nr:hypothetical protein FOA52_001341 [Chlamydomonas sp. UWO 241]
MNRVKTNIGKIPPHGRRLWRTVINAGAIAAEEKAKAAMAKLEEKYRSTTTSTLENQDEFIHGVKATIGGWIEAVENSNSMIARGLGFKK